MLQDALGNTVESTELVYQPAVHINDLPDEIFIQIFSNLTPTDLKDLRLVCRKWNYAVLDKSTWTRAFDNRFRTGKVFASATRSSIWLLEYFGRMHILRKWAKARAHAQLYFIANDAYGVVDHVQSDFVNDRLLTFSKILGAISLCTMSLGKNQVFIPESNLFAHIVAYDMNWSYLCIGNSTGDVYLKNLITATSSGSGHISTKKLVDGGPPPLAVKINKDFDKRKEAADLLILGADGVLTLWNLNGVALAALELKDSFLAMDTDFKTVIVVLSQSHIIVIDFNTKDVLAKIAHGIALRSCPRAFHIDYHDQNIILGYEQTLKIFKYDSSHELHLQGLVPDGVTIIGGNIQPCYNSRNTDIAGGDGRLYALTFSDGSVGVLNIRDQTNPITYKTRIMPFEDARMVLGIKEHTKVALNSCVIAIGNLSDWIHFYDAHSGKYLREGLKVSRKLTRNSMPILEIHFSPTEASGVVVCDDTIQYFRFGEAAVSKKRLNTPQTTDTNTRRAIARHIKAQVEDYDEQQHLKAQSELMADKYNGIDFEDEQDELRVALALSASCTASNDEETREDGFSAGATSTEPSETDTFDRDLQQALALSEQESRERIFGGFQSPLVEGLSRSEVEPSESEDEILRRVLELSKLDS